METDFHSVYSHGFIRAAVCLPHVRVADPGFNAKRTLALAQRASDAEAALALFPELGVSGYSNEDLFHQDVLLDATRMAVALIVEASLDLSPVLLVGAPLRFEGKLFNCAVVIYRGKILGIAPKTYLPNYREFYEKRQFNSGRNAVRAEQSFLGRLVPFGNDLVFEANSIADFLIHVEICEDLWTPIPPSTFGALAGATVLANLSASNITIGKAGFRRELCASQSARTIAGYLYTAAGMGESTTDLAWDGQALIYENGDMLAESERFATGEQLIMADLDLDRIVADRASTSSYGDSIADHRRRLSRLRRIAFDLGVESLSGEVVPLRRRVERFPYVPSDPASRN